MTEEVEKYFNRLWPICRSITGNGLRESLRIISELVPLRLSEVPSGTQVFDWTIPKEWNITDAYIITPTGDKICEFKKNNLHVMGYSIPIDREMDFTELSTHLWFIEELPEAIPYVTSYYKEDWGFCLSYNQFESLPKEGKYRVVIDSKLEPGSLTYGECVLKGETDQEVLFSTYLCHPSMANNELSGPLVQAFLYRKLAALPNRRYTYRFLFAPETVGVIAYLSGTGAHLKDHLDAGYVITCCGTDAPFVYKRSKQDNSLADRVAEHVLRHGATEYKVIPFSVGGSDERQYCSPGFNLPVGSLMRSMYQQYKEYHTSLDNKDLISFAAVSKTIDTYFEFAKALELNGIFLNTIPYCEPQLGKRGLYPSSVGPADAREQIHNRMHLLSFSDGKTELLKIADLRDRSIFAFENDLQILLDKEILKRID
jgi:aminopeptidase-like protein